MRATVRARLVPVVLTALGMLVVLTERATQVGAGWSSFVFAGLQQRLLTSGLPLPDELRASVSGVGYDGVGFYALALDPFSTEYIAVADDPAYRHQRILYPLLAWGTSQAFGQSALIGLVVVNVLAALVAAWLVAGLAIGWGAHPSLGAIAGLSPPMVVGTMHDTAEPLALTLMIAAIAATMARRPPLVAVLLTAAMLTRETTAVAIGGVLLWLGVEALRTRKPDWSMLAAATVPLVLLGIWQLVLGRVWGTPPLLGGESRLTEVPVFDWVRVVLSPITVADPGVPMTTQALWWTGRLLLVLAIVGATVALVRRSANKPIATDLLAFLFVTAAIPSLLTAAITWLETRDYSRTAGEWIVVALLIMVRTPGPSSRVGLTALLLTSTIAVVL